MQNDNVGQPVTAGVTAEGKPCDIVARTFALALRVVRLCQQLDHEPGVGWTIGRQLLRAGTSIGANVEEAQAGQSRADFVNKMNIALKEARETHYWLKLLSGAGVVARDLLADIAQEADELKRILGAIVRSTRRNTRETSATS
jgi:four helix bundle protein